MEENKNKHLYAKVIISIMLIVVLAILGSLFFELISEDLTASMTQSYKNGLVADEAEPYLNKIVLEDINLRQKAVSITEGCGGGDKECQVNKIYRNVVENYNYYSDPRKQEFIQSPYETMQIKGGDCEDLTILLNSLLENIGIKTYLVLTENHAYSLACGVDIEELQKEIISSLDEKELYDETVSLSPYYAKYYGGDGEDVKIPIELEYSIDSNLPVKVYIVPSSESLDLWSEGKSYTYYPSCSKDDIYRASGSCKINNLGGVLIINNNQEDAIVDFELKVKYSNLDLGNFSTSYYSVDEEKCIILDPSAGKYGYPGYDANLQGEKTAIDPLTKEHVILN